MLLAGEVTVTAWLPTRDVISARQWSYSVSALSGVQQKPDALDEIMTVEQQNQSNTTFSKTVICADVTSTVLAVYGKNIVMV